MSKNNISFDFGVFKRLDINLGDNEGLFKVSIADLRKNFHQIGIDRNIQRKFLFSYTPGGPGHKWQRELFLSLLIGRSIGQFAYSLREPLDAIAVCEDETLICEDENPMRVLLNDDGQQRTYTTMAIIENAVKLPDTITEDGYEHYAGKLFSELPARIQDKIFAIEWPIKISFVSDPWTRYTEFKLANNGNALSSQDLRSGQPTSGAKYIQSLVDGENGIQYGRYSGVTYPKYDMFQVQVLNDKCSHTYVDINPTGRSMEEIVANWYSYLRYGGSKEMNSKQLDRMYEEFNRGNNITDSEKIKFEKDLNKLNYIFLSHNNRKGLTKKALDYVYPVYKMFTDNGIKINQKTFLKDYLTAISKLKNQNKTWVPKSKKNGKKPTKQKFDYVFRQLTTNDAIEYIVTEIFKTMQRSGSNLKLDPNREFSIDQKRVKLVEQDYKCGYCGTEISDVHESHGDHTFPHSKGGMTDMQNLTVACPSCNQLKSDMTPEEWETFQKKGSSSFEYWGLVSDASRPFDTNNFNSATR